MNKTNLLIFGTGSRAEKVLKCIDSEYYKIIAFVDNDTKKHGNTFHDATIIGPMDIANMEYDKIVICSTSYDIIYKQLINEYQIPSTKIENHLFFFKEKLISYYATKMDDKEIAEVIQYIKAHGLHSFNYNFAKKYDNLDVDVHFDHKVELYYVIHNGKRMYFKDSFKNPKEVLCYYQSISLEQDESSPHNYFTNNMNVEQGDVVIDAGVAEGNFALDVIDKVKKIYLVETDEGWIRALKETFKPYNDRVVFVNKYLTNHDDKENITIDTLINDDDINYIKMDIEGEEFNALQGAKNLLSKNVRLKLNICVYHNYDDEYRIRKLLENYNFKLSTSKGYLFFIGNRFDSTEPRLVRGLLNAKKS